MHNRAWAASPGHARQLARSLNCKKLGIGMQPFLNPLGEHARTGAELDHIASIIPIKPIDHRIDKPLAARCDRPHGGWIAGKIFQKCPRWQSIDVVNGLVGRWNRVAGNGSALVQARHEMTGVKLTRPQSEMIAYRWRRQR